MESLHRRSLPLPGRHEEPQLLEQWPQQCAQIADRTHEHNHNVTTSRIHYYIELHVLIGFTQPATQGLISESTINAEQRDVPRVDSPRRAGLISQRARLSSGRFAERFGWFDEIVYKITRTFFPLFHVIFIALSIVLQAPPGKPTRRPARRILSEIAQPPNGRPQSQSLPEAARHHIASR